MEQYQPIIDKYQYGNTLDQTIVDKEKSILDYENKINEKQAKLRDLEQIIIDYSDNVKILEMGMYEPYFDFDTPEAYKDAIKEVRELQKNMLKTGTAVYCTTEWTVENSKTKGKKLTDRAIRLTARAFNNECDVIINNVDWNNIVRMQERMKKSFSDINKLNQSQTVFIADDYLTLKLDELRLAYEYKEKVKQERERQAEIRQQMREEARLEQEILKAQQEEIKYQKLLLKAQQEAQQAVGDDLDRLNAEIAELSQKLDEAHSKNERAISMAQQTKAGHIYVISNIGSFGENVYKIGMTRRLEPMERIYELGDASVPFLFDVHAMIYSEDAPALERALHQEFANKRLNLVNHRKEFFAVTLDEIQEATKKLNLDAEFITVAEAQEYNQSKQIRSQFLQ